ncbi:MAG: L-2-hydroxyglutarate oxidase [Actinomycetota bacterium]|nr:L-2-hydroxyglutarate oxidase [Actinomycetota bacterium]
MSSSERSGSRPADVAVVGAGIIGLATALALTERHPRLRLLVLDKEPEVGSHQTGHNSGVIHSGIYYRPGSLKARLCVQGGQRLLAFCEEHGIAYQLPGKVIVATEPRELPALEELHRRGVMNGLRGVRQIGPRELSELEPHATGVAGLHVPDTGIVDFHHVARALAKRLDERGVTIMRNTKVERVERASWGLRMRTGEGELAARFAINCAGLYADTIARSMGARPDVQIVPFRGEYYLLRPDRRFLVRGLIYPVPDARFPFLGVHLTTTIGGEVEAGPNAVLALAREGYSKGRVSPSELWETLRYPGFLRLGRRYWRTGLAENYRSWRKKAFVATLRRLVPEISPEDVVPHGAGVRAQAVDRAGRLIDDFSILTTDSAVHVLNAPSPGATASLAIGEQVVGVAAQAFDWTKGEGST